MRLFIFRLGYVIRYSEQKTKMKIALLSITLLLLLSCTQQDKNSDSSASKSITQNDSLDFNVALTFINDYATFCTPKSPPTNDTNWIPHNPLLTDNFKTSYNKLINSACKEAPELGLGFDPIFDAQDFPDKGFEILNYDQKTGFITVKGIDWPEFKLVLKVIKEKNKSLVDGSGVINIPSDKKAQR